MQRVKSCLCGPDVCAAHVQAWLLGACHHIFLLQVAVCVCVQE